MSELVIIRGLPGSGKTTMAKAMDGYLHYEADMFFEKDGEYKFEPSRIKDAHEWCQAAAWEALSDGQNVVVSNTFTTEREMKPYLEMCEEFNIIPRIIEASGGTGSIHGVPGVVLDKMRERWEPTPNARRLAFLMNGGV